MDSVVRADQEICADCFQLVGGDKHQLAHARPVAAIDTGHVVGQRRGVHGDLGMGMRAEDHRALDADRAVAQRRAFCRAGNDADVFSHARVLYRSLVSGVGDSLYHLS